MPSQTQASVTLPTDTLALTPLEAAYVSGVSPKTVNQVIDRNEVRPLPARCVGDSSRSLGLPEVLYLALRRELAGVLSRSARAMLYRRLKTCARDRDLGLEPRIALGPVVVPIEAAVRQVQSRIAELAAAGEHVVCDPEIRAGEPVVRGTRVPVHLLADLTSQGAPEEELLEDYPAVSREALRASLLYARTHPRRGRPPKAPWRLARRALGSTGTPTA